MFSSIKKIIAISLCVAMTLTNAGVSTFATSIERVATTAKQVDSNRRTIDYRFYEAFKYEKRTSYLMKDDESDSLKESTQQSEPSSGVGENTKTGDDVSPSFDVKNDDINDDKSRATSSDADDDSENDDENTTGNNIEEPEDDGTIKKVSDDDADTATVSDADDSSGNAATDEPEDDDTDTATVSDADDSSGSAATDELEDDDTDTATTSDADTTTDSNENDETESDDTTVTTSDTDATESLNLNDENNEAKNDDTTATTSNADVLNDDNKASDSDAKKLSLNLQPIMASDSESTLFGASDYILPNTWYDATLAGTAKGYVQSITIEKYPTPAPTTYTHDYEITGSNGLHVCANVTGSGTSQRSDVTIYAPADKTIYAAEDSSGLFNGYFRITNLDLSLINTSKVTNMEGMFYSCQALTSLDLSSFNTASVSNMGGMFYGCYALTSLDLSSFNTSNVTNMGNMFYNCQRLTSLDLSSFNTSNVTNMGNMFYNCQRLTSLDLSSFNTSKVTNINYMFYYCQALTSLDLSSFNTSNVTSMGNMFYNCQRLTSLDLSSFNTSNVTNMRYMFYDCRALTSLDLSSFNTSNVTNMENMFDSCQALTSLDLSNFNTSKVTNMRYMFYDCRALTSLDLSSFNTSNVTNIEYIFHDCYALTSLDLSSFNTASVSNMGSMFQGCYNLTSLDLSSFNTSNVTNMSGMFINCRALTSLDLSSFNTSNVTDMGSMFSGCRQLTSLDLSSFNTASVSNMREMFHNCRALTSLDLSSFNTSNVTNMGSMFNSCTALTTIIASISFVTTAVTSHTNMFADCSLLEGGNGTRWADRNAVDPTTALNKTYAWIDGRHGIDGYFTSREQYYGTGTDDGTRASSLRIISSPSKIDYIEAEHFDPAGLVLGVEWSDGYTNTITYNSTTMRRFTFNPATTSELTLSDTNVVITYAGKTVNLPINVTSPAATDYVLPQNWEETFTSQGYAKNVIKTITFEKAPTAAPVTSLYNTTIPGSNGLELYVTQNATAGRYDVTIYAPENRTIYAPVNSTNLFGFFEQVEIINNLSYLDTSNVTNMSHMFDHCTSLTALDVTSFDTSNATFMTSMFYGCTALTALDVTHFDTSNVTKMDSMFYHCDSLTTLDLGSFDTNNVTDMALMFNGCSALTTITASTSFVTTSVTNDSRMFTGCNVLVGGAGTTFASKSGEGSAQTDKTYARIDGLNGLDGYFTAPVPRQPVADYVLPRDWANTFVNAGYSHPYTKTITFEKAPNPAPTTYDYNATIPNSNGLELYLTEVFDSVDGLDYYDVTIYAPENRTIYAPEDSSYLFGYATSEFANLRSINHLDYIDTSNVTNMSGMFQCDRNLTILDLSSFNTSNVTNMEYMFYSCQALTSLDLSSFNTSNVTDMSYMFYYCYSLTTLDVTHFNTSNVTDMASMFNSCSALTTIIASTSFVTTSLNVGSDENMFYGCNALEGGNGTKYIDRFAANPTTAPNKTYAKIDRVGDPGYFTESGSSDYILPNTWYNGTSAGAAKANVQSITISKYPTPAPTTYTHNYTIPGSDGLRVYSNVTGTGTSQRSDVTIYAPENKTIYAARDSSGMFRDFSIVTNLDLSNLDTSNVTNMTNMFANCHALTSLDLSSFNTSNVTNMSGMFISCQALTSLDLRNFNTSNVTNMGYMFYVCQALTSLDLSSFNTASVSNMRNMFRNCQSLTSLDLSSFNTSNVTDISDMFYECQALTSLDLSSFNTSKVTDMSSMFSYCQALTSLDLSSFNTSNVTDMSGMFHNCQALTTIIASTSFVTIAVTSHSDMFGNCQVLVGGNGTRWSDRNAADPTTAINKTYAKIDRVGDTGYFTESGSSDYILPNTWYNETSAGIAKQYVRSITISKYPTPAPTTYTHDYEITGSNGLHVYANVTGSGTSQRSDVTIYAPEDKTIYAAEDSSGLFYGYGGITNLDLSLINTSKVTNMLAMFEYCQSLTTLDLSGFDTSNVTSMSGMFAACSSLTTLDVTHFDTSNVTSMNGMFAGCRSLTTLDVTYFDTSNVTSMYQMFSSCQSLTTLDVTHFDTSNVTNMSDMFSDCSSLTTLNVTHFNTSNVTRMDNMFSGCSSLTSLDVTHFNTSNVTDMSYMFYVCRSLTTLDVTNFDTRNVTDMSNMFGSFGITPMLTTIIASTSFVTTSVTHDTNMFNNCSVLVGGAGTTYANKYASNQTTATNKTFAWIDGRHGIDGYFTSREQYYGSGTDDGTRASSLRIISSPSKIDYIESEHFDPTGLVLGVEWSDGYTNTITYNSTTMRRFTFNPATTSELTTSDTNVVITYAGETVNLPINVTAGVADYVLPATWAETLDKTYAVQSITILKAPSVVPTGAVAHSATIPNSNGLKLYQISTTGPAGTAASDLIIYAPTNGTIYAPNDSSYLFSENVIGRPGHDLYLTSINNINYLDTSNVTNMSYMFSGCDNFTTLDVTNFDTRNVTDMSYMFSGCSSLTTLDVMHFNTSNVITMAGMFNSCSALTSLDLSSFNTASVSNMEYMFRDCLALTSLDLSSFNTSNVTNMGYMFRNCRSLTSLDLSSFNTSNVTSMGDMFSICYSLTSLDLSSFNTSNVTNMSNMFSICFTLTSLDLSSFNTSNVTNMGDMFRNCRALTTIIASTSFVTIAVTSHSDMFGNCQVLVGGNGTRWSDRNAADPTTATNKTYAWIDGRNGLEGYFAAPGTKTLRRFVVKTAPTKTTYALNETFDPTGLVITAQYTDNTVEDITYAGNETSFSFSPVNMSSYSINNVVVTYRGKTANLGVTVSNNILPNPDDSKTLSHITVKTYPQTLYTKGASFNPTGLVITAHYTDDSVADVDYASHQLEFSFDPTIIATNCDVVVTYKTKTTNIGVLVSNPDAPTPVPTVKTLNSFVIKTAPKTTYALNETFDPTGLVITAQYTDNTVEDITYAGNETSFSFSPVNMNSYSINNVVVTYRGKTANLGVTVSDTPLPNPDDTKALSHITVKTYPQTTYTKGASFNPNGLVITAHYTDNSVADVDYASHQLEFSFDPTIIATSCDVVVTYKNKTTNIGVLVSNPSDPTPVPVVKDLRAFVIKTAPKTTYALNETFDPTGLVITAQYTDNTVEDITYAGNELQFSFNPVHMNSYDIHNVVVTYRGKTANLGVTVSDNILPNPDDSKTLSHITVKTYPQTLYTKGANFNPTGLVITAHYTDDSVADVDYASHQLEFSFDPTIIATSCDVVVTYKTKTTNIGVLVSNPDAPIIVPIPKEIDSITIKTLPKTHYNVGETFDPTGLEITVNYVDTTSVDVAYAGNEMSFSFTPTIINNNGNVILTYKGKTVNIPVTISNVAHLKGNGGQFTINVDQRVNELLHEMDYGESTAKFEIPDRTGYRFNGYYVGSERLRATWSYITPYVVDVDARWLANNYKVKFDNNGGVGNLPVRIATYDETFRTPSTGVTKDGYQLSGWMHNGNFYSKNTNVSNLTSIHDDVVTLVASWSGLTYDIIYHGNGATGGNTANQLNLTYGIDHTLNANGFTKTDYTFNGWALSTNSTVAYGNGAIIVKEEDYRPVINLYARWIKTSSIAGTLTLQGNGGLINGVPTFVQSYMKNEPIAEARTFRRGYNFDHWSEAGTVVTYPSKWDYTVNAVTLDANWNNKTFQVRYVRNDSNFPYAEDISASMNYGASYTPVTAGSLGWTKAKHTFSGWSYERDAITKDIDAGVSVVLDTDYVVAGYINLYPVWDGITYNITYSRFNPSNFALNRTENYTYGSNERIIAPATLSYVDALGDKYIFAGWTRNTTDTVAEFSSGIKADTIYDAYTTFPISIVGLWIKESDAIYLTFDAGEGNTIDGGDRVLTKVYSYGDTITYPTNVHKRGHLLGETTTGPNWRDAKNGNVFNETTVNFRDDKTVNACYRIGQYHLTYVSPQLGITGTTVDKNYDENFAIDDFTTERIAYTFAGWDIDANANVVTYTAGQSVSGLGDVDEYVTLFTVWDERTYTIKYFDQNNNQFATANLKINDYSIIKSNPNIPENAADKGYKYEGGISHAVKRFSAGQLVTLTDFEYSNTITEFDLNAEVELDFYGKEEYILAPGWYTIAGSLLQKDVSTITIDMYPNPAPSAYDQTWDIPASNGLKGYRTGTNIYIYAPKRGIIYTADNCRFLFSDIDFISKFAMAGGDITRMNLDNFFKGATTIDGLNLLDTSRTTNMQGAFAGLDSVETLNLESFETSHVTAMDYMFYYCNRLKTIFATNDFSTANLAPNTITFFFYTLNLTGGSSMFTNCNSLVGEKGTVYSSAHQESDYAHIDGGLGNPGYFTMVRYTFAPGWYVAASAGRNQNTITKIRFVRGAANEPTVFNKKWNIPRSGGLIGYTQGTEAIVYAPKDYEIWTAENSSRLFSGTTNTSRFTNLTTIENLELLNTEATTNFSYMFYRCEQLTTFNLNGFDTSFAKEMQFMFDECESVVTLDLRSFDTARVENMSSMFSGCANLTTILATYDFVVDKVTYDSDMFADTTLLEGGAGTVWSSAHTDKEYARIDEGPTSTSPGYFKNTSFTFSPGWYMGSIPASNITKITFSKFPEPEPTYADTWTLPNSNGLKGYRQGTEVVVYANVDQMIYANKDSSYLFSDSTGNPNRLFTSLTTIASVSNVVTKNITNASYLFAGCENLTTVDIHSVETNKVTNIAGMFKDCKALTKIDLVNLVTSYTVTSGRTLTVVGNVTNMEKLFMGCTNLATISNIQTLVTNNAVNMSSMFEDCISLRSVDLSGFDTSKAVNLSKMFKNCSSFTTIDVMNFRADSCENMSEMFMNCSKVTELKLPNGFRTTEVIDMSGMFDGMSKVPSLNISGFNTAKVTDMSRMFANCASLSTIFVSPVFKTNAVISDANMFANSRNIVGGAGTTWESRYAINPATAIDKTHARVDGGPTSTSPGYFTNGLYVLSTHWYDSQFGKTDPGVSARGMHPQFITKIILSKWPEASPSSYDVTWDIPDSNGLVGYRSGTEVTIYAPKSDISSDIYTTEDASYIFSDFYDYMNNYVFTRLEKIENLNYLNIDNAKSVQGIFYRCNALKSVDLSNFDTRNVNDMSRMFYECQSLEKIDASTIDTSKVTNMERLFAGCQSLREINLGNLDISNVENIDGIFERCYVLPELDLTSFDASSVTSMKSAFESCSSLVTVYASDGMESASISPGGGGNAFTSAVNIRGGLGTAYTPVVVDQRYAKRDGSRYGGIPTPGYFTGGRHRVVLRANGGVYQNGKDTLEMIIHEEEMTARFEEPTRSGYTFANYKVGGSILTDLWEYIDRDTIYVDATWTPNNYRVVYNANGGEGIMPVDIATSGEIYTTRYNAFTRAGYEFDGWSYDGNTYLEDEEILTPLTYEKDGEVVLRAVWKGLEYKVYYHGNGATGGSMNTDTFTYGSNQTIKNNAFTRTNYEFNGWALSANGHVAYGNKANLTTHEPYVPEIHLYAKWIMTSAIKGTLVLDGNGGYINGVPRFTIKFTEYDIIPEVSKYKKGYVFTNWTENGVARDYPTKCNFTNLELAANWNYETYTIRYHANDGSGNYIDDVIPFGTYRPIKPSNTFNRFGYNFRYWSYKSKDDTKAYDAGFAPTEDLASKNGERIDLFAVWRGKDYTITLHNWEPITGTDYVDSFVYGTGKNIAAISTTSYTSGITTYLFSGWATAAGGVVTYLDKNIADVIYDNTTSVASGNIDLYAIWIDKNDATYLTFDGNGGLVNGQKKVMMNLRRGSTIPFPNNNLKRFGYEKNGWLDQDKTTAFTDTTVTWTGNKIIYANWNPGTYTIKYIGLDADAGVTMTDEVKGFEETFDLTPNAYTRLGYNFVGWDTSEDADSVVYIDNEQNLSGIGDAGAVVHLYSVWEDNIYNLKFYDRNNVEVETRGLKYTGTQTIASNSNIQLGYKDAGYEYNDGANDVKFSTGQRVTVADFNINSTTTDIELFGQEEKETYIVAFDPNGGAINGSTSVKLSTASYLDKITVPTPIRNGYEFKNYKVVNSDVTCDTNNQIDYNWTENVTFTADWDPIVLVVESITITKNPKLEYIIGQVFDPSGLEIKAKYNDGTTTPDIKYDEHKGDFTFDVSLEDPLDRLGNRVVTVTYKGAQKSFNISVRDWYADENVSSIKITKKPQTKYTVDDTLNPTGLEIEVTYTDGRSNRTVAYNTNRAMFAFNPNTTKKLQLSDKKVTVSFGGMKDSYDIVVEEIPVDEGVSEMKIIKPPAQVNYIAGQKLDPSGLVIEVTYSADSKNYKDGTKKQISYDEYVNKFSFNPNTDKALTLTDENVTVIFGGKTDTFGITVIEAVDLDKDVFSIKIKKVPNKVNYIVGEKLNPRGLVLEVTYSNNTNNLLTKLFGNNIKAGKTFFIDYNTFYNLFSFVPGITQPLNTNNKIVTLTFGGKEATFDITVSKNSNAYGPSNGGGGSGGGGGGGRLSGGLPVTEMNTVIETITLSSDYDWIYDEEGQREGVKLKKESSLAKSLMSSNDYKENYKDVGEEGYIQIQNGFYNLQYAGASFYFGFNSVGKMLTGFVKTKDDTEHYWVDDTKFTLTDIGKQDSAKYYLYDENGDYKGIIWNLPITIGNTLYTFDVSGKVLTETYVPNNDVVALSNTGWEYNPTDDSWKYYNTDSMGNRYYIRDEVKEITDRGVSHYYIFGEDEKMKTGLTEYKGKTYYLLESGDYKGAVYTGMLPLGGKVLTFDEQGVLVSDKKEVKALNTTQ